MTEVCIVTIQPNTSPFDFERFRYRIEPEPGSRHGAYERNFVPHHEMQAFLNELPASTKLQIEVGVLQEILADRPAGSAESRFGRSALGVSSLSKLS